MKSAEPVPQASVALIEWQKEGASQVLVLQRADHPHDPWSGNLAFPGGRWQQGDLDLLQTCTRETHEECGFLLQPEDLVCGLPMACAGHFHQKEIWVKPWHFRLQAKPCIRLDLREMQRFFWVDRTTLMEADRRSVFSPMPGRSEPCMRIGDIPLWGFTLRVLDDWLARSC